MIIVFFIFLILGSVFTYPLIFKFNTFVPGFYSTDEIYGVLRQFWWYRHSWLKHISYIYDPLLAAPFGSQHNQIFIYPLWEVLGRWLSILSNEVFAYNLIIFFSLLASGILVYYLLYYLTKNTFSSILSGIIYAFCPYYFARIWQHFGLTQIQWFSLCLLALFKVREKSSLKNAIFLGLAFFLVAAFDYQYAYFAFIITVAFIVFLLLFRWKLKLRTKLYLKNDWKIIKIIFWAGILAFLLTLPATYPMFKNIIVPSKGEASVFNPYHRAFSDLFEQSARPLSYFIPAVVHPLLGKLTENFVGSPLYGMSITEHTLYLGWVPLILAFIAFRKWKILRKTKNKEKGTNNEFYIGFFLFLAVIAWLFSQPPWWKIGPIKIYMPSFFMYKVLPMFRAYCRFGIVVMLSVAVLAGFGLRFILDKFKSPSLKITITTLFCALVLFEFWNYPPFKVINVSEVPAVYYWVKEQAGDFAIAEYPLDINGSNEMYKLYQTKHQKKIINGTVPGTYANKIAQTITKLSQPNTAQTLKSMQVKYVLVHRQAYLDTGLIEWIEELNKIPQSPYLKFIKGARGIDVYEVTKPK